MALPLKTGKLRASNEASNLMEEYIRRKPDEFEYLELETMHRTENAQLLNLIDSLRLRIQVDDPNSRLTPKQAAEELRNLPQVATKGLTPQSYTDLIVHWCFSEKGFCSSSLWICQSSKSEIPRQNERCAIDLQTLDWPTALR